MKVFENHKKCDIIIYYKVESNWQEGEMSNYLGSKCIMCGQEFKENDDIVVCPDCGTPYHRAVSYTHLKNNNKSGRYKAR